MSGTTVHAIVSDGKGGIPYPLSRKGFIAYSPNCGTKWGTAKVTYRYLVENPNYDEDEDPFRYMAWDGNYQPFSKTSKVFKVYVASVSGATEKSDTGDGSQSNPYTCLNSALHALQPPIQSKYSFYSKRYNKAYIFGCFCGEVVVQIVLTGVVDYTLSYSVDWIDRLIITGDSDTEFDIRNVCDVMAISPKITVQNCTIRGSENYDRGRSSMETVFENCKVSSPFGVGTSANTLLYNSQFHTPVGASYIQLQYLYGSSVYLENGVGEGVVFGFRSVNACQNLIRFTEKSVFGYRGDIIGSTITSYSYNSDCTIEGDIINSSITHTLYMDTYDYFSAVFIGIRNIYNSNITGTATIQIDEEEGIDVDSVTMILGGGGSRVIEDSQISFTVSHYADYHDYDPRYIKYFRAYVFNDVGNSAFKNVIISGSLASPSSLPVRYAYRLCWAGDAGPDFVVTGGHAFSRIEYVSDPSLSDPCPVDPY